MWITNILLRRHVPGRIFSGKHRVTMKITKYQRKRRRMSDELVKNNEMLISHPFLTVAEEHSHSVSRNEQQRKAFFATVKQTRTLGEHVVYNTTSSGACGLLEHLNVTET